ncbi:MAG: 30S ribosomal protein S12 methylthiotransferase RimO [Clostridiales bacterium]|nr:30S ribosomal protein S12 methylthiotransferase RimO [Clostridiales bacterium]MDD7035103.1 30S ribosomal protein S12 methylthiotransferase RimO [Bacillota bacterium]
MKLYIETLGCPKNFNDSEGAAGIWEKAGMEVTDRLEDADVIMVNTCGFINDAKKESIDTIFDMIRFADEEGACGRRPLLAVSGCLSQRYSDELAEEMPEVDLFLGVNEYERLPELVRKLRDGEGERVVKGACPEYFPEFSARKLEEGAYSSTLRIAEGCNNRCAYCVIPSIRGSYRSRSMENITAEAEKMAAAGVKEIILIAQDVTEYGRDLYGELKLPELLRRLCRIEGIRWIRLMYCYEDKISDELIEVMAEEEKICNYIDIPLQHISDNVLRGMHRRSTSKSIRETIGRLRKAMPDIHIRTTFITGFPGETEEDFEELADFAEEARFERLGVFAYSREEGTEAGEREDQIDEEVKAERADCIMRLQLDISREVNEEKVGSIMEVLVESVDEDGCYVGRTVYDAPEIDGTVIFTGRRGNLKPGDFTRVKITDAFDYDLTGEEI